MGEERQPRSRSRANLRPKGAQAEAVEVVQERDAFAMPRCVMERHVNHTIAIVLPTAYAPGAIVCQPAPWPISCSCTNLLSMYQLNIVSRTCGPRTQSSTLTASRRWQAASSAALSTGLMPARIQKLCASKAPRMMPAKLAACALGRGLTNKNIHQWEWSLAVWQAAAGKRRAPSGVNSPR